MITPLNLGKSGEVQASLGQMVRYDPCGSQTIKQVLTWSSQRPQVFFHLQFHGSWCC
jgi:hypothetical protein